MLETKGRKTVFVDVMEFAKLLKVDIEKYDSSKLRAIVHARIAGIDLGEICGRCGGTGNYSYNQLDGTKCYGCNGNRTKLPKLSEAFYEKVKEVVTNTDLLDKYFDKLKRKATVDRAKKAIRNFVYKSQIARDYESEYDREQQEDRAERRRVDALVGGRALGKEFAEHYNPTNITKMNETVKAYRFKQCDIEKEYKKLDWDLFNKGYGRSIPIRGMKPLTDDEKRAFEDILLAKYEEVMQRLGQLEDEYKEVMSR